LRDSRFGLGAVEPFLRRRDGRRDRIAPKGFSYKFGDFLLNCHGPGITPKAVARVPVEPGGNDLCFEWPGPLAEAVAHLQTQGVAIELGPVATRGVRGEATSVYFREPDGSLLEFMSYAR
jgi:catechol 2,3-dioxygenase-like lactoylglutathione lyase family enzyme